MHLVSRLIGSIALVAASLAPALAQTGDPSAACKALASLDLQDLPDGAVTRITSATLITAPADGIAQPTGTAPITIPINRLAIKQYCEVQGYVTRQNKFVLKLPLPEQWNRRFFFMACAGACGSIDSNGCNAGLAKGYASVTSNGGHDGSSNGVAFDAAWGANDPALQDDFAARGNHVVTIAAKAITEKYYGAAIKHAYMSGCSKGGQAVLIAAMKYPGDFDGLIPVAPVWTYTDTSIVKMSWTVQSNSDGKGGVLVDAAAANLIHQAVLNACDAGDGVVDGLVSNPFTCTFNPVQLLCTGGATSGCLSAPQVAAAQRLYATPTNSAGQPVYNTGYTPGSETEWPAWIYPLGPLWISQSIGYNNLRYLTFETSPPTTLSFDPAKFNFDADPRKVQRARAFYDAGNPDLSAFKARGGKIVLWHGLADAGIPAYSSVDYWNRVAQKMGGKTNVDDFFRMFFLPGVHHCSGGPGPYQVDWLDVIDRWVEGGVAPEMVIAAEFDAQGIGTGVPRRTRPAYRYPNFPQYRGVGDPSDWHSFMPVLWSAPTEPVPFYPAWPPS